jgi:hypothetical protein
MKDSEMKKGMYVTISKDPVNTSRTHTTNGAMRKMAGKTYTIHRVYNSSYGVAAEVLGWTWHPKDLIKARTEKKPQTFHFNAKELVI